MCGFARYIRSRGDVRERFCLESVREIPQRLITGALCKTPARRLTKAPGGQYNKYTKRRCRLTVSPL